MQLVLNRATLCSVQCPPLSEQHSFFETPPASSVCPSDKRNVKVCVEEWWNGGMVEWRNGGMEEWWNGGIVEWWNATDRRGQQKPVTLSLYTTNLGSNPGARGARPARGPLKTNNRLNYS